MESNKGKLDIWLERNSHNWWFPILMGCISMLFFPPFWIYIYMLITDKI